MKIKTKELIDAQLDWAVAQIEQVAVVAWIHDDQKAYSVIRKESFIDKDSRRTYPDTEAQFYPSVNWLAGGEIIDREEISIAREFNTEITWCRWSAWTPAPIRDEAKAFGYGSTPLIAAMRCHVANHYGDEIEIPDELVWK